MDEPGGEGGGPPQGGPPGPYPWAGRFVVVTDDAGHQTSIYSDASGAVTQVLVQDDLSESPVAPAQSAGAPLPGRHGETWRRLERRRTRTRHRELEVAIVAGGLLVLVLGIMASVLVRKAPGAAHAHSSRVDVLSSTYSASPAAAKHVCVSRTVLITWTLQGARPGAQATITVTGSGHLPRFDAPVGVDGKTVRVSLSFPAPSKANAEITAVDGKPVRPPVVNPASAITLAC